ncbi:hypothetical protein V8C37DRAFT_375839 [Trichoderma ceciliae]
MDGDGRRWTGDGCLSYGAQSALLTNGRHGQHSADVGSMEYSVLQRIVLPLLWGTTTTTVREVVVLHSSSSSTVAVAAAAPRSLVRSSPLDIIVRVSSCQRHSACGVFCTYRVVLLFDPTYQFRPRSFGKDSRITNYIPTRFLFLNSSIDHHFFFRASLSKDSFTQTNAVLVKEKRVVGCWACGVLRPINTTKKKRQKRKVTKRNVAPSKLPKSTRPPAERHSFTINREVSSIFGAHAAIAQPQFLFSNKA